MWPSESRRPAGLARLAAALIGLCLALSGLASAAAPLPDSLGLWYKPQNKRQVWLHTMFAMRRELQAVREYATAQDGEHLAKWAQRLSDHYRKLPEMVPEWREEIDLSLIDALDRQVGTGNFDAVSRAADHLQRDCRSCHRQYQALAALRYRWPRFDALEIANGEGGRIGFAEHMEGLSTTLNRVKIASDDGRWNTAQAALGELRGQLHALAESCQACHDETAPRERILGRESTATLDQLDQALNAHDAKAAGLRLGEAAVQTCARCHGVHRMLSDIQHYLFD